ncbi:MAG TPA: ATP-binding protein [Bryobacteraceae bacterium]|nr:ATP-binding protein [Bryobacteraceae bacterium]
MADTVSILNVDDYAPGLYARTKILKQAGFDVMEATTGNQTLKLVAEHKPAVVLLDVNLPDMDGFEVCRRIRNNPALASTTILHISASSIQEQQQVHGLNTGADGYLIEPLDPAVLVATIKAYLRARQAETALRRSNEDLERFAYRVTHELSEPLRTITMHGQLLEISLAGKLDPDSLKSFEFLQDGARRMRAFIDDLLRYSQASHVGSDVRPLEMEMVLSDVVSSLGAAIQESAATITHDPLPVITVDSRIEHVLQNLISNAIKYCRKGDPPRIHLSAQLDGDTWLFSVRDNGIGIEPQYTKSIFQVFQRLHGRDIPGTGVGLALAQKIIETNAGKMWVESQPGIGSTFYFTIPNAGEEFAATQAAL